MAILVGVPERELDALQECAGACRMLANAVATELTSELSKAFKALSELDAALNELKTTDAQNDEVL